MNNATSDQPDQEPESGQTAIIWFREDLRVRDNPALTKACEQGLKIIPLYILDEQSSDIKAYGGAKKWFLHHCLQSLQNDLDELGLGLVIKRGPAKEVLQDVIKECDAKVVYWNRRYGKAEINLDTDIKASLSNDGLSVSSFAAHLLHEPAKVQTGQGGPYRVYTPFWREFSKSVSVRDPLPAPKEIEKSEENVQSSTLEELDLLPRNPDWSGEFDERWPGGSNGAHELLDVFLKNRIDDYDDARDLPAKSGTSRLSPYLSLGAISPYEVWKKTREATNGSSSDGVVTYKKELVWREFAYHLLYHYPDIDWENYNRKFDEFPWIDHSEKLEAWQKGQTGYPIVDAGMRELWQTGWMHNRVRMIVGSFLVKNLLIHWKRGEEWFWDTLVDADRASNAASWQWIAGSGADAAPYFRIFNPILQGEKFDKDGGYVRQYVPELQKLPNKFIHKPWEASSAELNDAGVELGKTYPHPIVDHGKARDRALEAYQQMKEAV